jgi:PAS domain S-box-containing protein
VGISAEEQLRTVARQQAAVAELGQRALGGLPLEELVDEAVAVAARELDAELVSLLELTGDGKGLLIRAGHGWPEGVVGGVLSAEPVALPGFALRADGPVLVEDFSAEARFQPSELERDLGVVSSLAAPIGSAARDFGVLGAHTRRAAFFSRDDAHFAQALANVVGAAVERSRADELVRDSEARFRELADTTPALMWTTDQEGRVTFVNAGWLRFTGRALEEELGDTFAMSAHPEDREELRRRWQEALTGREELHAEYRLRRSDGEYRWVQETGVPRFARGEFLGYVGTATDIHERRLVEEALRESEQSFRELADSAPVMIWTTDADGLVTFVNEGWLGFTGRNLEEKLGASWTVGVHPDDADELLASWLRALTAREPWQREYRLRRSDGEYRWIVDRGVPRYEGGRFVGYVGTATDIHERRAMEERLRVVYEREHRIAETLQRSLLPERLPEIDGVALAARYLPAGRGAAIGGDWYDALELKDGRVALVVGDVVGHGLRAAATMGQLRNACRAYALVEASPSEVVARLNRLLATSGEDAMATVLYLVLDRETGEVAFTSAGHPPPLILTRDGASFLEGGRSVPVGAADPAVFREASRKLPTGASLLLYTDGLVERRDVPLEDRLGQLEAAAAAAGGELEEICDQVLDGVLGSHDPVDDVALLAVRPEPASAVRMSVTLPAEPESLAGLRRRLGRFLHAAGVSDSEQYEITLTVCEAAGNAIEHAYGPGDADFHVEVRLEGQQLTADVRDEGRWREPRGMERGRGLQIIEGLMDDVEVLAEEGGTVVRMRRRLAARMAA